MTRRLLPVVALWLCALTLHAQTPVAEPPSDAVAVDALQCWRDVRSQAIRVGEPFTMTVTCGVVETDAATTVANEGSLAPETIDLAPFEVVEGRRHPDRRDGVWRFFQYEYAVRFIGEDMFGEDVELPELAVTYRIERRLDGGSSLPGRELRYLLPAVPVRIVSLVPADADDIRGPTGDLFGDADTREFRADLAVLVATVGGIGSALFLVAAGVRARRHWTRDEVSSERDGVSTGAVVRRALGELVSLQRSSEEQGWTGELAARVLAVLRVAGAAALSIPVAQQAVEPGHRVRDGELMLRRGLIKPRRTALSSAVTADAVEAEIARLGTDGYQTKRVARLRELLDAIRVFTETRYAANGDLPTDELTRELDASIGVLRELRVLTFGPVARTGRLWHDTQRWWTDRRAP